MPSSSGTGTCGCRREDTLAITAPVSTTVSAPSFSIRLSAVMASVSSRLQPQVPVPLLDGITAGVRQAELLARARYPKPATGSYAPPGPRELIGADPALVEAFKTPPR